MFTSRGFKSVLCDSGRPRSDLKELGMKKGMSKKLVGILCFLLIGITFPAHAQKTTKVPRIGYISGTGNDVNQGPYVEALRQGLRELGYVEGKTFTIEYRGAEGNSDRIPILVAELVERQVDILIAPILPAILAAKQATKTVPIIMVAGVDPVASKLVDSLARPGGNLTGLSTLAQDLSGKRLELLRETLPRLFRVAVLRDVDSRNTAIQFEEYDTAARLLKIEIQSLEVRGTNPDLESAFLFATKGRNDALITITNANILMQQRRLVELAVKHRLPSMFHGSTWVDSGGLMSSSTDEIRAFRRAATYVDKILKGAKPADLPVEQTTKFELVINLKTAKQIGITVPQWVLVKADRVIR
jgi:putative ABC transport system substrate-binding protein